MISIVIACLTSSVNMNSTITLGEIEQFVYIYCVTTSLPISVAKKVNAGCLLDKKSKKIAGVWETEQESKKMARFYYASVTESQQTDNSLSENIYV